MCVFIRVGEGLACTHEGEHFGQESHIFLSFLIFFTLIDVVHLGQS